MLLRGFDRERVLDSAVKDAWTLSWRGCQAQTDEARALFERNLHAAES